MSVQVVQVASPTPWASLLFGAWTLALGLAAYGSCQGLYGSRVRLVSGPLFLP